MKLFIAMFLSLFAVAHADVLIGVPEGRLIVQGSPGAGQTNEFTYSRCETTANGDVRRFGCDKPQTGKLNTPMALAEGDYELAYSGTRPEKLIYVKNGETTAVQLAKLAIEKADGGLGHTVFRDLGSSDEQSKFLREAYGLKTHEHFANVFCMDPRVFFSKACQAWWNPVDSRSLLKGYIAFEGYSYTTWACYLGTEKCYGKWIYPHEFSDDRYCDGTLIQELTHGCFSNLMSEPKALNIASLFDGQFVSVFPGTYGIHAAVRGGKFRIQTGIQVRTGAISRVSTR